MSTVVALGDVNVDIIAQHPDFPVQGRDTFVRSAEFHCGGSAANASIALARLGVETTLIARVGADPWSAIARQSLGEAGVDLSALQCDPHLMTGFMYIIVTPDGDRTILGYRGANAFTDPSELRQDMFYGARALHLSGYALLTEPQRSAALLALDMARRHSLIVALDPGIGGNQGALEDVRSKLRGVDLVLPNLAEAQELTDLNAPEDCAQALVTMGVEVVVVKLGRDGCLINFDGSHFRVPGFTIRTYDSTGAGDSFAAGLLAAHLGGLDWRDAGVLANAMGALTAARVGAGSSTPTAGEVLALLQSSREESNWRPFRKAFDRVLDFLIAL